DGSAGGSAWSADAASGTLACFLSFGLVINVYSKRRKNTQTPGRGQLCSKRRRGRAGASQFLATPREPLRLLARTVPLRCASAVICPSDHSLALWLPSPAAASDKPRSADRPANRLKAEPPAVVLNRLGCGPAAL